MAFVGERACLPAQGRHTSTTYHPAPATRRSSDQGPLHPNPTPPPRPKPSFLLRELADGIARGSRPTFGTVAPCPGCRAEGALLGRAPGASTEGRLPKNLLCREPSGLPLPSRGHKGFRAPHCAAEMDITLLVLAYAFFRSQGPVRVTPVTLAAVCALVAIHISPSTRRLIVGSRRQVELVPRRVLQGDLANVVVSALIHADTAHILFNSTALVSLGCFLELRYAAENFFCVLWLSLLLSELAFVLLAFVADRLALPFDDLDSEAIGFSGVVFALQVLAGPHEYIHVSWVGTVPIPPLSVVLDLVVLQLLIPRVSFLGHLGGVIAGLVLVHRPWPALRAWALVTFSAFVLVESVRRRGQRPFQAWFRGATGHGLRVHREERPRGIPRENATAATGEQMPEAPSTPVVDAGTAAPPMALDEVRARRMARFDLHGRPGASQRGHPSRQRDLPWRATAFPRTAGSPGSTQHATDRIVLSRDEVRIRRMERFAEQGE